MRHVSQPGHFRGHASRWLLATVAVALLGGAGCSSDKATPAKPTVLAAKVLQTSTTAAATTAATTMATTSVAPAATTAPPAADGSKTYKVQAQDNLSSIAREQCGSNDAAGSLYAANKDRPQADGLTMADPNQIEPGWELLLVCNGPSLPIPSPKVTTKATTPKTTVATPKTTVTTVKPVTTTAKKK